MDHFLQECRDNLEQLEQSSTVKVVMGNESCDLDSAVCALVYAQVLRESLGPSPSGSTVVLPVLNIPQCDLPLKTEVMFYLAENDVPLDLLIFRDQIDLRALSDAGKLQLTLVDFHVLTVGDEPLRPSVVEVIDHRPQEQGWEWEDRRVTIEIVGSCCTLIARKLIESAPGLLTSQVALLLFGALMLDTVCLSPSAGRATPADHHVAEELSRVLPGISKDEVFHLLHQARSNTHGLTAAQLLAKDLKIVGGHTPMPAMQLLLQDFLKRAGALTALQDLCNTGNYKQCVLMGMKVDEDSKNVTRELAIYSEDASVVCELCAILEGSSEPELQLEKIELADIDADKLVLYNQKNVKASRKQVLPIVRAFRSQITALRGGASGPDIKRLLIKPPNGFHIANLVSQDSRDKWEHVKPYGASNASDAPCSLTAGGLGMEGGSKDEYITSFNMVCMILEQELQTQSENGESPSDEKMDISDSSVELAAELVHAPLDNRPQPAARTSVATRPSTKPRTLGITDTSTDNLVSLSSALASLKLPASLAEHHLADEPVDFPSSPTQMKLLTRQTLEAQGLPVNDEEACEGGGEDDDEDTSIYQAVLSPDCTDVRLLKDDENETWEDTISKSDDKSENVTHSATVDSSEVEKSANTISPSDTLASVDSLSSPSDALVGSKYRNGQAEAREVLQNMDKHQVHHQTEVNKEEHSTAKGEEQAQNGHGQARNERSYSMASTVDCVEFESLVPDGTPPADLEEYFEDLPMQEGQHVMSRQESFRRRMKGMKPDDAAEFARIGRVVASGELSKHDSIRRKLVGHNSRPALFPTHFEEGDPRALWAKQSDPLLSYDPPVEDTSLMLMLDRAQLPDSEVDQSHSLAPLSTTMSFVDDATLSKVKACFDAESFKDLYTLAGRLQDLLSPLEVEEIIRNSSVYSAILDQRIVSALALTVDPQDSIQKPSVSEQSQEKAQQSSKMKQQNNEEEDPQEDAEEGEGGFMFVRHDSKRLSEADADRVIEGLFVESRTAPNAPKQKRKLLHIEPDILTNEPQSPEEPSKMFTDAHHTPVSRSSDVKPLPANCLVLDVNNLNNREPLSRQLAAPPAERQRVHRKKRIAVSADLLNATADSDSDDATELPDTTIGKGSDEEVSDVLSLETPDELEESIMERLSQQPVAPLPELSAQQERAEERNWRSCVVAGLERQIDMKVIAPYKRVLHHGGYLGSGNNNAIIVFTACYLPDRSRVDYDYVMDNLFLYVLTTLDQLVAEDYVLVYLHGATARNCMPSFSWLKRCYHMIDRRLRKNLKGLYLVHPTFWLKTIVVMTRPFVSTKFTRKLSFVETLTDLAQLVPLEQINMPERVKQYDLIKQTIQQLNK